MNLTYLKSGAYLVKDLSKDQINEFLSTINANWNWNMDDFQIKFNRFFLGLMFFDKPKCTYCEIEIKEDDVVFVKMRYPKRKGFTEIKAYLRNEGKFICEECFNSKMK